MTEGVLIRMGVDARPVTAALRGVRKEFATFKADSKNLFNDMGGAKGVLGGAGGIAVATFGGSSATRVQTVLTFVSKVRGCESMKDKKEDARSAGTVGVAMRLDANLANRLYRIAGIQRTSIRAVVEQTIGPGLNQVEKLYGIIPTEDELNSLATTPLAARRGMKASGKSQRPHTETVSAASDAAQP